MEHHFEILELEGEGWNSDTASRDKYVVGYLLAQIGLLIRLARHELGLKSNDEHRVYKKVFRKIFGEDHGANAYRIGFDQFSKIDVQSVAQNPQARRDLLKSPDMFVCGYGKGLEVGSRIVSDSSDAIDMVRAFTQYLRENHTKSMKTAKYDSSSEAKRIRDRNQDQTRFKPPDDPKFQELLENAVYGEVAVYHASVPLKKVVPYNSTFSPISIKDGKKIIGLIVDELQSGNLKNIWVYPGQDEYVMSDDYFTYAAYTRGNFENVPCWILGQPTVEGTIEIQGPIATDKVKELLGLQ